MWQLNLCFADSVLFSLIPLSGKAPARSLFSQADAKVDNFGIFQFWSSDASNPLCRDGTCSITISLDVFSLGKKEEAGCKNQLFTLLGPGLLDQGPILCGELADKTGLLIPRKNYVSFDQWVLFDQSASFNCHQWFVYRSVSSVYNPLLVLGKLMSYFKLASPHFPPYLLM